MSTDVISNHRPHDCLLNCLFRRRSKKTSKLRVTGLCAWNSPGTGEFPAQMASNVENVSISWRHRGIVAPTMVAIDMPHCTDQKLVITVTADFLESKGALSWADDTELTP